MPEQDAADAAVADWLDRAIDSGTLLDELSALPPVYDANAAVERASARLRELDDREAELVERGDPRTWTWLVAAAIALLVAASAVLVQRSGSEGAEDGVVASGTTTVVGATSPDAQESDADTTLPADQESIQKEDDRGSDTETLPSPGPAPTLTSPETSATPSSAPTPPNQGSRQTETGDAFAPSSRLIPGAAVPLAAALLLGVAIITLMRRRR